MKKLIIVVALVMGLVSAGMIGCNSSTTPSTNGEGITELPPAGKTIIVQTGSAHGANDLPPDLAGSVK